MKVTLHYVGREIPDEPFPSARSAPQHSTPPVGVTAHEWVAPTLTATALFKPLTYVGNGSWCTRGSLSAPPLPS